jgi:hypothetical protein
MIVHTGTIMRKKSGEPQRQNGGDPKLKAIKGTGAKHPYRESFPEVLQPLDVPKRVEHGHWAKGASANPKGGPTNAQIRVKAAFIHRQNDFIMRTGRRPLSINEATAEVLREHLSPLVSDIVNAQITLAFDPDVDPAVRRHALNDLLDRSAVGPVERSSSVKVETINWGQMHLDALRELSRKPTGPSALTEGASNGIKTIEHQTAVEGNASVSIDAGRTVVEQTATRIAAAIEEPGEDADDAGEEIDDPF